MLLVMTVIRLGTQHLHMRTHTVGEKLRTGGERGVGEVRRGRAQSQGIPRRASGTHTISPRTHPPYTILPSSQSAALQHLGTGKESTLRGDAHGLPARTRAARRHSPDHTLCASVFGFAHAHSHRRFQSTRSARGVERPLKEGFERGEARVRARVQSWARLSMMAFTGSSHTWTDPTSKAHSAPSDAPCAHAKPQIVDAASHVTVHLTSIGIVLFLRMPPQVDCNMDNISSILVNLNIVSFQYSPD